MIDTTFKHGTAFAKVSAYYKHTIGHGHMQERSIILALSRCSLRDELLLYFGHSGARVYIASRNTKLVKLIKTNAIDCILMPMYFKNEDAIELILKVLDINKDIPVVLIDQTEKSHDKLAKQLRVAAYFKKPFSSYDIYKETEKITSANSHRTDNK